MKNIVKLKADVYILTVCFIYAVVTPILWMGDDYGGSMAEGSVTNLILMGLVAAVVTFLVYYIHEALYSFVLYRLSNELAMFVIGIVINVGYLTFLTRFLFVGSPFNRMITNVEQLNEGFANATSIVAVLIALTVASIIYGHSLGETIYRVALMYMVAIGNVMILLYFNPLNFQAKELLLVLNVFMIYFTLRQLVRCRGLVVHNKHHTHKSDIESTG